MKLNSFISLTYHLSVNLKTNVGFLERILFQSILLVMHEKLIGRRCQFYIDRIQKCTIVFKLKIFNLHIQDFRYKMLYCIYLSYLSHIYLPYLELFKQRAVIAYFAFLDLSIYLLFNQKYKGTFHSLQEKFKKFNTRSSFEVQGRIQGYIYVVLLLLLCCSIILYF